MNPAAPGDRARVSVGVAVPPGQAFRIFTEQIELWWRRGPRFRHGRGERGLIALEPQAGGRVFESFDLDGTPHVVEIGRIRIWQPPQRLLFDWQVAQGTALERTEVEVLFEAVGDHGTRVTVTHRGWAAIRADHPARHGRVGSEFSRELGLWWGDLLAAWRLHCAQAGR